MANCELKDILDFARSIIKKSGHNPDDVFWCHAEGNNQLWSHLATVIWMKMTGRIARGYDWEALEVNNDK